MSTAQDVRRKRIQSDKDTLEQLDDSARHLRQARADAQGELVAAQAKLDAIDLALDDVQNRRRTLSKSLDVTRSAFLLALWAGVMPADVLRAIFLAVHALPDKKWLTPDHAMHNKARARRPFRLSAVCRQWRKVALDTSALWTYISPNDKFPDVHGDLRAVDVALIRTLLRRSKRALLDVVVIWSNIVCTKGDNLCEALALISEHATRLRRVYTMVPPETAAPPSNGHFSTFSRLYVTRLRRYPHPIAYLWP
ncbi:hypothetical protein EXIGLDRAFT_734500 [Exidia glandulosa HHB12029]|uniref:Uncharacterized protein n=1 Tax=Exidia glandulosa HHB12029 TaxID=1314781 RepID=A0A166BM09_EXIGL|nr:hypothetical protein EXIGLDRAFT_734500 [Exidia glandulosa HHB12029]